MSDKTQIYFAGGYYYPLIPVPDKRGNITMTPDTNRPRTFGIVHPGGGLPYVCRTEKGLAGTSHHANIYRLGDDGKTAYLVRCACVEAARFEDNSEKPVSVETLTDDQAAALKAAVERGVFYDEV